MAQVIKQVYGRFGVRLTQKKLGQAVPVVGVIVGAGLNAATIRSVAEASENIYRERFLREKYGMPELAAAVDVVGDVEGDVVDVADILEAEIVEDDQRSA